MTKIINVTVHPKYVTKYRNGYPLIHQDALANEEALQAEGSILHLLDKQGKFIAKGYYGKQNKGLGWILTNNREEKIEFTFFKEKIETAISKRKSFYKDELTNAFRVFNGEGDGIGGLTIDYFAGYYLINWYSEGIYTFKNQVIRALDEWGNYKEKNEKKRIGKKGQEKNNDDIEKGVRGNFPVIVKEKDRKS